MARPTLTTVAYLLIILLAVLQLTAQKSAGVSRKGERDRREVHNDTLVFPEHPPRKGSGNLNRGGGGPVPATIIDPTPCPDGQSYCVSADDYPRDYVRDLIEKHPGILNQIPTEEEDDFLSPTGNRFGTDPNEVVLCPSEIQMIFPDKAKSKEGLFEFIVNEGNYKQGIRMEVCVNAGNTCNIPGSLSLGYKSQCEQKTIQRTLVVVNRNATTDLQGFVLKSFDFPSCCNCKISMVVEAANRFRDGGASRAAATPVTPRSKTKS